MNYLDRLGRLDPRSLACFRIGVALVVLYDAAESWSLLDVWIGLHGYYDGLPLPGPPETAAFFLSACLLLWAAAAVSLLVGYRTGPATLAVWLGSCGHQFITTHTADFHDVILCNFLMWGLALPWGRAFALDGRRRDRLNQNDAAHRWGASLFVLFFAYIYLGTAFEKSGAAWWSEGDALWLALNDIEAVGAPGLWATLHLPLWVFRLGTHVTWAVEFAAPLLILSPWRRQTARLVAVALLLLLHGGMWLLMDIGAFPTTMMAGALAFLPAACWRRPTRAPAAYAGLTPRARALAVLGVLVLVGYTEGNRLRETAAEGAWPYPGAAWVARLRYFMALEYRWNMYAPQPPAATGWWVGVALDADGRAYDPITGAAPTFDRPVWGHAPFAGRQGYYWSSPPEDETWPADEYIRYLQWQEAAGPVSSRFVHLTLVYVYEPIDSRPPGQRPFYPLLIRRWPDNDAPLPRGIRLYAPDYERLGEKDWVPQALQRAY